MRMSLVLLGLMAAVYGTPALAASDAAPIEKGCTFSTLPSAASAFVGILTTTVNAICPNPENKGAKIPSAIHVVQIDTTASGISFSAVPSAIGTFTVTLPSQVLIKSGSQIAINANLFQPCNPCVYTNTNLPASATLSGLEMNAGQTISPVQSSVDKTRPFTTSLIVSGATLQITTLPVGGSPPTGATTAVTGSNRLLSSGDNDAPLYACNSNDANCKEFFGPNARTGVGLSASNTTLWLVAIDGGSPSQGMTLEQEGELFTYLHASNAVNLDGGGSTTMVAAIKGKAVFLNNPKDSASSCTVAVGNGCERYVGATFLVHATPR